MTRYQVRVHGTLSDALLSGFPQWVGEAQPVQTVITGQVQDAEELAGIVNLLSELGVGIVEILSLPDEPAVATRAG